MRLISYFSENSKGRSNAKKIYNYHKLKLSVIYLSINGSFFGVCKISSEFISTSSWYVYLCYKP